MLQTQDQKSHLQPRAQAALGRLSPQLLKVEVLDLLSAVLEDNEETGQELLDRAQLGQNYSLDELLEVVRNSDPITLANELVEANHEFSLKDLPKRPPLDLLKAVLEMLQNSDR